MKTTVTWVLIADGAQALWLNDEGEFWNAYTNGWSPSSWNNDGTPIYGAGAMTFGWSFLVNGRPAPQVPLRVELLGPEGDLWTWGPADAEDRITGPALDFCLLATQRRHRDDLAVTAVGDHARAWLPIAQAFAGPPGPGREKERS